MRFPLTAEFLQTPLAHRAYHDRAMGRVENSPSAVQAALDAGYGIELDVQLSSDGQAMVFHDDELDRLTAEIGSVRRRSSAELQSIPLTDSSDTIPTLSQILAQIAGRVPLLIEIKDQSLTLSQTDGRLELAVATALADYSGPVAVMSFNPHCIAHMRDLAPNIPRGLTTAAYDPTEWAMLPLATCARLRAIEDYDPTASTFISHEAADLDNPRVAELKSIGARILCWTIRSPQEEATARRIADNVTFEGYAAPIPD